MKLDELLAALENWTALPTEQREREVLDIVHDSRKVTPGSLFVALRGAHADGHQFIPQALRQGALAVVAEETGETQDADEHLVIRVPDSRSALARIAAAFYGNPSRTLKLIGITGTKGKTTTSYLAQAIIEAAGHTAGLIGTIGYHVGSKVYSAPNTTPESLELQKLLGEMVEAGAGYCVMEVSSHALALGRSSGCRFETAVFTNLAQDHLDFHLDLASYFQAKLLLFTGLGMDATAVINIDDAASRAIIEKTPAKVRTYGLSALADICPAGQIGHGISGLSFTVKTPIGFLAVDSPLVGRHNVYNILAAIGVGVAQGFGADVIAGGIRNMKAVPGRMEKVDEGQPFGVLVDYAHTEDSLICLLEAVREMTTGKVITVFGCGGDRDRIKRPGMGKAAARGSDAVIITTDNPRTENPERIISEIAAGIPAECLYEVIPDRAEAIKAAIDRAQPGDVVVLAGKGHEEYQIIGEEKIHFDDRVIARAAIRERQRAA